MKYIISALLLLSQNCFAQVATTQKSGKWSSASTWKGGKVPARWSTVTINHTVTVDSSIRTKGITVNGTLSIASNRSATITNVGNILINGLWLDSAPANINHRYFIDSVDESKFQGTTMDVTATDPGIYLRNGGRMVLKGAYKTPYAYAAGNIFKGTTKVTLARPPTGWLPGDKIAIAPTAKGDFTFDTLTIKSVLGSTVTFTTALQHDHPFVANPFTSTRYTAEVLNLTRNIVITGGPGKRSHINIMANGVDTLMNVQISYMGVPEKKGRYPLHFHMNDKDSWGSLVSGCVVSYSGNHGYVAHKSDGISFKNDLSFDTFDAPYWWDNPPTDFDSSNNSNNFSYDNCGAALIRCDPPYRGYRMPGFEMQAGRNNSCTNCFVVGNQSVSGNGFNWGEAANRMANVWKVFGLLVHNNAGDGELDWQNDSNPHEINNFCYYNNGQVGLEHGAYHNGYKFNDGFLIGNKVAIFQHANAVPNGVKDQYGYTSHCINVKTDGPLIITKHLITATVPFLFKDCVFTEIQINELPGSTTGMYDFVNCTGPVTVISITPGSVFRFQANGKAWMIDSNGTKDIPLFFK